MADSPAGTGAPQAPAGDGATGTQQPTPAGSPPAPVSDAASRGIDFSKIGETEINKLFEERGDLIFSHPRFKELNDQAKEAKTLRAEKEAADKKQLEAQGKWQELAQKEAEKSQGLMERLRSLSQDQSLTVEAQKLGVTDIDAALKLVDRTNVTADDNGQVTGAAEAIKALVEAKPYLATGVKPPVVGSATNPGTTGQDSTAQSTADGKRIYKLSELQDSKFYKENQADIRLAAAEGRMINDTGAAVGVAGGVPQ
jgi:hypothetical protein